MGLLTLFQTIAIAFFLRLLYRKFNGPLAHLPGPEISKWTGLLSTIYWFRGQKPNYVHYLHETYGPIVRIAPEEVDICDITAAKEIHKTGGRFLKSKFYNALTPPGTENVFSTTDPAFHTAHRRLLATPISDSSLTGFEQVIAAKAHLAVRRMAEELRVRGATDVFKWWLFMATDVIGELSFGESFRMLESGQKNQYILDLEQTSSLAPVRTTFPALVRLGFILPLPVFRRVAAAGQRLSDYAQQSIDRYARLVEASGAGTGAPPTLFTKLYHAGKEGLSTAEIRNEARAYIVAGSDTTAISLTYLVYAVCREERIRARLVDEVAALPEGFDDRMLRELRYLNWVIDEALRLYTVVPLGLPRVVPAEGAGFLGYRIPGGATVATQAYSLHRDGQIFPEPERFYPERWETVTKEMKEAFMPFGKGARACLGIHLARRELRLATVLFFRAFPQAKISSKEGMDEDDMEMKSFFLMGPKGHRCLIEA